MHSCKTYQTLYVNIKFESINMIYKPSNYLSVFSTLLFLIQLPVIAQTQHPTAVQSSGGGTAQSDSITLISTAGQPLPPGQASGSRFTVTGGFIPAAISDCGTPIILHTPVTLHPAGQEMNLEAIVSAADPIQNVTIFYRQGGEADFTPSEMTLDGAAYRGTIPGIAVTSRGLEYYIEATNNCLSKSRSQLPFFPVQVNTSHLQFIANTPPGAYRMISIPAQTANQTIAQLFQDNLGAYDSTEYRIFENVSGSRTYRELTSLTADLPPGKALWLITKDSQPLDVNNATSVKTDSSFSIQLAEGYNMIGVPFNFPVSWNDVTTTNLTNFDNLQGGTLAFWDGSQWELAQAMEPFRGYLVKAISEFTLQIPAREMSSAATAGALPKLASGEWHIRIKAVKGGFRDQINFAGVRNQSKDDWDRTDIFEPPPIGNYVSLYFDHRDWPEGAGLYTADFRSPGNEGYAFDFTVNSSFEGRTTLSFDPYQIPGGFDWVVVSPAANTIYPGGEIITSRRTQEYRLLVGSRDFLTETLQQYKTLPVEFALRQNYPNPFNPETNIPLQLPQEARVTATIFTILGQRVKTLFKGEFKEPGYYTLRWNGTTDSGQRVTSGIYILKLNAGQYSKSVKMVLMR